MSYQTILLVIQGLPRQAKTIDRFSAIIGAPFRGKARCLGVIIDAFKEFWGSAYVDVNEPDGGWPAAIKAALQASRQGDEVPLANQDHGTLEPTENDLRHQSLVQGTAGEASRENLSAGDIESYKAADITPVGHSIQSNSRDTTTFSRPPSTPRRKRHTHVSTPPRRPRTSSSPKTLHALDPEPRSPLTDLRKRNIPSTSLYTSPTPKVLDKENVGPKPLPDIFASVLGKRKMEPTIEDSTGYVKRRISSSRSLKTARVPEATEDCMAILEEGPMETVGDDVFITPSRKRKSEVFAGVVVPTVKEVMLRRRHSAPLREVTDSPSSGRLAFVTATGLRKSRSTTGMEASDHRNGDELDASPRKKMRTTRSGEPKISVVDFPVAGSGKSTRLHPRDEFETDSITFLPDR